MGYVIAFILGHEIEILEADVIECMQFFQCSYDDALYHMGYAEYLARKRQEA